MQHDPNNSLCDRVQYGDSPEVRCTCDIDTPDDGTQAPSVVMAPARWSSPPPQSAGTVVLTGMKAALHNELEAATREFRRIQAMLAPAEARWRKALDAYSEEMLKP